MKRAAEIHEERFKIENESESQAKMTQKIPSWNFVKLFQ